MRTGVLALLLVADTERDCLGLVLFSYKFYPHA